MDNRVTKAHFRGNPPEERKLFSSSSCLMPISVGQPVHEGEKFEATIHLVERSFQTCTILVDDSVQRHTIAILNPDKSEDELYKMAIQEGDKWIERSQHLYNSFNIPLNVLRWDDWFNMPEFAQSYKNVKEEYQSNPLFKQAINANIDDFLERYLRNNTEITPQSPNAISLCLDYLLEECAVMCLWVKGEYDFELYPSGRNKAMAATYDFLIKPSYPEYLKAVALRFKKYGTISALSENIDRQSTSILASS
ncbi:TPA: hypothetical protein KKX05_002775 [Legionella pneumophila]|nr:hypothetical protein [Legionella pneumophila]HAU1384799.1 hypothetical protein [Legionella pneumophila]HAU2065952.1 hypothetical protein [Legionella pneumophila]HBD7206088.1 hypothetical protein [Legionella pneumophila]HBD9439173.1 hypothetical protein [Legionella pneumophila]